MAKLGGVVHARTLFGIFVLFLAQLIAMDGKSQTNVPVPSSTPVWSAYDDVTAPTADGACRKQHDHFNPNAIYQAPTKFDEANYYCHWDTSPPTANTILPAVVFGVCDVGYIYNGVCYDPHTHTAVCDRCHRDPSGALLDRPTEQWGDPVDVSAGNELNYETDYASADGLFRIERRYSSAIFRPYNEPFLGFGEIWQGFIPGRLNLSPGLDDIRYSSFNGALQDHFSTTSSSQTTYSWNTFNTVRRATLSMVTKPSVARPVYYSQNAVSNGPGEFRLAFGNGEYILFRRANDPALSPYSDHRFAVPVEHGYPSGYKINYDYPDSSYFPNVVRDNHGRSVSLSWQTVASADNETSSSITYKVLASVTLPDGSSLHYDYDRPVWHFPDQGSSGPGGSTVMLDLNGRGDRLTSAKHLDALGNVLWQHTYIYENSAFPYALTGTLDQNGARLTTISYDQAGLVASTQLAGGLDHYQFSSYYTADGDGNVSTDSVNRDVVNPLGLVKHYNIQLDNSDPNLAGTPSINSITSDATANVPASTVTYDSTYNKTDERGLWLQYNNIEGDSLRPETITEAAGLPEQRDTQITWHTKFDVPTKVVQPGLTTAYTYSTTGQLLTLKQTDTTTQTVPYSTKNQARTWTYTWNANGTLASVNGPKTAVGSQDDVTSYGYDTNGNLQTVTDALGHVTTFSTFDANGRPASMTDPNGVLTNFTYDALGRATAMTVKHPTNSALDATTSFDYDIESRVTGVTLPDTDKLIVDYDLAGRVTAVRAASGERIDYQRNAMGGVTSETVKRVDGSTRSTITRTFDELNRVMQVTLGTGRTKTFQYDADGNVVQTQLSRSNATTAAFDGLNRLSSTVASDTGATSQVLDPKDGLSNDW